MADTRIDELRRRLERDPGSRLIAQLAEELRKAGELEEAIRVARAGLALHPAYPSARLTLGRALLDSGDAGGARAELEGAVRDAPDNILASRCLGQAREAVGDLKGSAEQYRKTLLMAPGDRQLEGALAAVEARLKAQPAGGGASGQGPETIPPPPPLGTTSSSEVGAPSQPTAAARRTAPAQAGLRPTGAPPVVSAPSRPLAPGAEPAEGGELPATLRIRASQSVAPRPAPAPPPPPAPSPSSARPLEARPVSMQGAAPVALPQEKRTPPGAAGHTLGELPTPFSSTTLAELYFQQGLVDRARDVYRQLLEQDPHNDKARGRLDELEHAPPAGAERAARSRSLERTIAGLETLLAAVRRR